MRTERKRTRTAGPVAMRAGSGRTASPALLFLAVSLLAAGLLLSCSGAREVKPVVAQDQFEKAKNRFDHRRYLEATEQFKLLLDQYPGSKYAEPAAYYLAKSHYETKEYPLAEVEFDKLLRDFPRGSYAEEAAFMLGMCAFKQKRPAPYDQAQTGKAIVLFNSYLNTYPGGTFAVSAEKALRESRATMAQKLYLSGLLYVKMGDAKAARVCFQEVLDNYGEARWADLALVGIGRSYEKERNWGKAAENYRAVVEKNGDREALEAARKRLKKVSRKLGP